MFGWFRHRLSRLQIVGLLFVTLFAGSVYVLGWSSLLTVKHVQVVGAPTQEDRDLISGAVNIGQRLARVDTRAVTATLKKYSWLKSAKVDRNWFKGLVTIKVTTRQPLAIVGEDFVDEQGVSFSLPHKERFKVPLILADSKSAKIFAADLVLSLPVAFRKKVEVVSVEGLQTATLLIKRSVQNRTSEISVRWGDASKGSLKLRVYQSLLALPENAKIVFMDLSAPHAPIVR